MVFTTQLFFWKQQSVRIADRSMGHRLPRQTARKSRGGRGLPEKTNNVRDSIEDGRGKRPATGDGGGAADQSLQDASYRPLTPSERDTYRPLTPPESKEVSSTSCSSRTGCWVTGSKDFMKSLYLTSTVFRTTLTSPWNCRRRKREYRDLYGFRFVSL